VAFELEIREDLGVATAAYNSSLAPREQSLDALDLGGLVDSAVMNVCLILDEFWRV
jgi:hypothetical protein